MILRWIKELYEFYFYMFYVPFGVFWWMDKYQLSKLTKLVLSTPQLLNLITLYLYLKQFGSEFTIIIILGGVAILYFNIKLYGKNEGELLFIEQCKKLPISRKLLYLVINICYIYISIWLFGVVSEKYHLVKE